MVLIYMPFINVYYANPNPHSSTVKIRRPMRLGVESHIIALPSHAIGRSDPNTPWILTPKLYITGATYVLWVSSRKTSIIITFAHTITGATPVPEGFSRYMR